MLAFCLTIAASIYSISICKFLFCKQAQRIDDTTKAGRNKWSDKAIRIEAPNQTTANNVLHTICFSSCAVYLNLIQYSFSNFFILFIRLPREQNTSRIQIHRI